MSALAAALPTGRGRVRALAAASASAVLPAASAVTVVHLLDDAVLAGNPGTSIGGNLLRAALPALLAVAIAAGSGRLRPGLRAWVAFVYGALAVADAGIHLAHAGRAGGLSGADVSGLAVGLAGLALLALAASLALRPKAPRRPLKRWAARAAATAGAAATLGLVVFPLYYAMYVVHKPAAPVSTAGLPPHAAVTLHTSDGLALAASYVPSRNGAAVVLVPGSGGDRSGGVAAPARLLARHGYGVLVYDPRGTGESEGRTENLGWTWSRDVAAAVDYLAGRADVDHGRIGALGLSTGAEAVLDAAARDPRIAAVVAEGAQARHAGEAADLPASSERGPILATLGVTTAAYRVLALESPPERLQREIGRIAPRPTYLISVASGYEAEMNAIYARAAHGYARLWQPDAPHTGAQAAVPREYERRVVGFLDRALSAARR